MAVASISVPMLRLARSAQSGSKIMTAAYAMVYLGNSAVSYIFGGANFDLSGMALGDIIDIRIRKRFALNGAWINHDVVNYVGPVPANHQTAAIAAIVDIYGIEISLRQTAVAAGLPIYTQRISRRQTGGLRIMQAILHGVLTDDGGLVCDVCFEWGDTPFMGTLTPWQGDGVALYRTGGTFSQVIDGLVKQITYYFRAVARNAGGTSYGATLTFRTPSGSGSVVTLPATEIT